MYSETLLRLFWKNSTKLAFEVGKHLRRVSLK
jgi:hypothetical protein